MESSFHAHTHAHKNVGATGFTCITLLLFLYIRKLCVLSYHKAHIMSLHTETMETKKKFFDIINLEEGLVKSTQDS